MSRKNKYGNTSFVAVRRDLLKDPEWQKLTNSAKILWIYLRSKYNNKTKDSITLAYIEMEGVLSTKTFSRAMKELINEGWVEKIKQGGLYGGLCYYKFRGKYKDL